MLQKIIFFLITLLPNLLYSQESYLESAIALMEKGIQLKNEAKYDSSIYYFDSAGQIYKQNLHDSVSRFNYVRSLKYICFMEHFLKNADTNIVIDRLNESVSILGENHYEIASFYKYIGLTYYDLSKFQMAKKYYLLSHDALLKHSQEATFSTEITVVLNMLGMLYDEFGDFDQAAKFYTEAIDIIKNIENTPPIKLASLYNNIANIYQLQGFYQKAIDLYHICIEITISLGKPYEKYLSTFYGNLGSSLRQSGQYEQAIRYYHKSIELKTKSYGNSHESLVYSYNNLGIFYLELKEYDNALNYFNKCLKILHKIYGKEHTQIASTFNNIGNVYSEQKNYKKANSYYNKSLDIYLRLSLDSNDDFANPLNNLGDNYFELADYENAIIYFAKSAEIREKLYSQKHPLKANSYNHLASSYHELGLIKLAKKNIQKALNSNLLSFNDTSFLSIPASYDYLSYDELMNSLLLKLKILKKEHEYKICNKYMDYVDTIISINRKLIHTDADRTFIAKLNTNFYEIGISITNNVNSFYFSERNKGGSLQRILTESKALHFSDIPDSIVTNQNELKTKITFYNEQLRDEKINCPKCDSIKISTWQSKLFHLHLTQDSLKKIIQQYPEYQKLTEQKYTTTVPILQKEYLRKHKETAVIEYFWGDDSIYIFAITNNDYQIKSFQYSDDFKTNLYSLIRLLSDGTNSFQNTKELATKGYWAYQTLLSPIIEKIKDKNHWLIIPDGDLYKLPFGTLLTQLPVEYNKDYSLLSYLANDKEISYHFSATLLLQEIERKRKKAPKDFIGFAPVFESNGDKTLTSVTTRNIQFASLPGTEAEVKGIFELYNQENPKNSKVFLHDEATEHAFKTAPLKEYKTIMVSTHGFTDDKRPEFSGIAFYPDSSNKEDDILYSNEMYNLKLNADLVILAGCETGRGERMRGEGLMGLTRGLFYSGAKRVLSSLWKVSDQSTAILNLEFQKYLQKDHSYPKALQSARKNLIKDPKTAHPYYWSAFVLLGE